MRQEFEEMAKELGVSNAIEFTGWKSGFKQVQAELLRGHFFVFPSSGEGLPRSVIEAMASGLLCFGSKIDGVVELLNEKMNKDNINRIAIKHGLNVLNATVVNKGEIPSGLEYPIITKPIASTMGAWKGDMYICNSEEDLKEAYGKILSEKLLLQKYIHKKNEYCLEGLSVAHGQSVAISIASSYNYILDNGYSPYMTVRNFDKPTLGEKLKEILKEIGYEGIFEIEFLVDENDQLWFCEINFRNSTWSYASTCAGMNLPYKWAEYMRQGKIDSDFIKKVPSDFTAMVEVHDYANRVKTNKISKLQWFNELRKCKCRYFLGKNDLMPVLSMFMHKLEGKR